MNFNHQSILPRAGPSLQTQEPRPAVLLKGRSSTANLGTQAAVLLGMDKCGSFPLLSASHSLFSISSKNVCERINQAKYKRRLRKKKDIIRVIRKCRQVQNILLALILKILYIRGHTDDNFERKNLCLSRDSNYSLQFSVLAP